MWVGLLFWKGRFLNAIAPSSNYPCQWVSGSVVDSFRLEIAIASPSFASLLFTFPQVGTQWLNYVLAPSVLLPLPLLLLVTEQYKRGDLDGWWLHLRFPLLARSTLIVLWASLRNDPLRIKKKLLSFKIYKFITKYYYNIHCGVQYNTKHVWPPPHKIVAIFR